MRNETTFKQLFSIGIIFCLLGAFFMIEGNIFGERTTIIAIIVGYIGIFSIAYSSRWKKKKS
jgi:hypothetical protein